MRRWTAFVSLIVIGIVAGQSLAEDATIISLGGPRKVQVMVAEKDESFVVTATMIPVRCFDPGMNKQLNRQKAESYVLMALGRYLTKNERGTVTIRAKGVLVTTAGLEANRYQLQLEILRSSIRASVKEAITMPSDKPNSSLLLGADYDAHIEAVAEVAEKELPSLPIHHKGLDAFYRAIADCEERTGQRYDQLQKEIEADRRLLNLERDEFVERIQGLNGEFVETLKRRVAEAEHLVGDTMEENP